MDLLTECICSTPNPGYKKLGLWTWENADIRSSVSLIFPISTPTTSRSPQPGKLYPIVVCGNRIEVKVELVVQHQSCHREDLRFSNSAEGNLPHGESIHTAVVNMYSSTTLNKQASVALAKPGGLTTYICS